MPRSAKNYKLIYFNLRGKAEAIRLIFAYAKVTYEDIRIEFSDWPTYKPKTKYGQVPLLEVNGKQLAQSHAIARYLAKEFDLLPESNWEQAIADELVDLANDLLEPTRVINPIREPDEAKRKEQAPAVLQKITPLLEKVEATIAANPSGWLVGDKLSWVDLVFFAATEYFSTVFGKESFANYSNLHALAKKVKEVPQIAEYLQNRKESIL